MSGAVAKNPRPGKGVPGPGRPQGSKNRFQLAVKQTVEELCRQEGVEPIRYLCKFVIGRLPCASCLGGTVPSCNPRSKKCRTCKGTGIETVSNGIRLQANIRLMDSVAPRLKAIHLGLKDSETNEEGITLTQLLQLYAEEMAAARGVQAVAKKPTNGHTHIVDVDFQ